MKDLEYYYWVGFFAADGTFRKQGKRLLLKLTVAKQDESHLELMKKYFGANNCWGVSYYKKYSQLIYHYNDGVECIRQTFDLKERKTYNPPDLKIFDQMSEEQFLSFFIGYTDGDGCIQFTGGKNSGRKDVQIGFHVHRTWNDVMNKMRIRLEEITGVKISPSKIGKDGYARFNIGNTIVIRYLKNIVLQHRHPYLTRTWNKIDENRLSKYEWQRFYTPKVIELRTRGYTFEKIGTELGIKTTSAFNYFNGKNGGSHKGVKNEL